MSDYVDWLRQKAAEKESSVNEMSMRDYFAAKAMQGMLANPKMAEDIFTVEESWIEQTAWSIADAMLKHRSK